jgi:hypothetical protein
MADNILLDQRAQPAAEFGNMRELGQRPTLGELQRATLAAPRAGRLHGYIAPTFGTIAGGRSNLGSIAAIMNEGAV